MTEKIDRFFEKISVICCFILIIAGITMSILTFLTAISRKIGISALTWTDEVNRYCFIYMTYIGMVVCALKGKHARVDLIFDIVKGKSKDIIEIAGNIAILIFLFIMLYGVYEMLGTAAVTLSPVLHIPLNIVYMSLFIGSLFTILVYIWKTIKDFIHLASKSNK